MDEEEGSVVKLSSHQEQSLDLIGQWLKSDRQYFLLGGYAGTGKTTLMKYFVDTLNSIPICCAPTGKAASVLGKKLGGAALVSTIHHVLYNPLPQDNSILVQLQTDLINDPTNDDLRQAIVEEKRRLQTEKKLHFELKDNHAILPGQVVIIDEASMVTERIHQHLLKTKARILYVGDPGQLPPVKETGFFHNHPLDAMLTEIRRQSAYSPIIRLSKDIRDGKRIPYFEFEGCKKVPKGTLDQDNWMFFDQVITGRNATRRKINRFFRRKFGHEAKSIYPVKGEKVICLKNEQEGSINYINGIQGAMISDAEERLGAVFGDFLFEGMPHHGVPLLPYHFAVHYDETLPEEPWMERQGYREFDYAYAITVHKSQGSEWDRVLIADDELNVDQKDFRRRWLYTAVTRARKELVWIC